MNQVKLQGSTDGEAWRTIERDVYGEPVQQTIDRNDDYPYLRTVAVHGIGEETTRLIKEP